MFILRAAALLGSLVLVSAAPKPNQIFERAPSCNANNCYRAVTASAFSGGPARGSSDCSSFFKTTVSPCTKTTTFKTTTTVTASTRTTTSFATSTSVSVAVSTSVTSVISTSTTVTTESTTSATLVTSTTTVTSTSVVLFTATASKSLPAVGPAKRQASAVPPVFAVLPGKAPVLVQRQAASTCSRASTILPSSVPAYASACSTAGSYSSACSCLGISGSTVTLATPTFTFSTTVTRTVTPTTTVPATRTATTSSLSVTGSIALSTVIITTTTTVTSTSSVTTTETETTVTTTSSLAATVTIQPKVGPFGLQFPDNTFIGITAYDTPITPNGGSYNPFYLDEFGILQVDQDYPALTGGFPVFTLDPPNGMANELSVTANPPVSSRLTCALASPSTRSGRLSCTAGLVQTQFALCDGKLNIVSFVPSTCTATTLTAFPVGP